MYKIGLTTNAPPPFYPGTRTRMQRAHPNAPFIARWAPVLYKAHQTNNGHWIWKMVKVVGESKPSQRLAFRLARELSQHYGMCRVTKHALGNKRIQ